MTLQVRQISRNVIEIECSGQKVRIELPVDKEASPEPVVLGPLDGDGGVTASLRTERDENDIETLIARLVASDYEGIATATELLAGAMGRLPGTSPSTEVRLDWRSDAMLDVDQIRRVIASKISPRDFNLVVVPNSAIGKS